MVEQETDQQGGHPVGDVHREHRFRVQGQDTANELEQLGFVLGNLPAQHHVAFVVQDDAVVVGLADIDPRPDLISLALRTVTSALPVPAVSERCGGSPDPVAFDDVVALPQLQTWARLRVRALSTLPKSVGANTLQIWLAHDARFAPTARELGLSEPGVRKRLLRIESALGMPITLKPVNQYDLWLACRALKRCDEA